MTLASLNRRSENVSVFAVIIAELELSDVQRYAIFADRMQRADGAAFEDRPTIDCMHSAISPQHDQLVGRTIFRSLGRGSG